MNEFKMEFQLLIEAKKWKILKQALNDLNPHQIAETIGELSKTDQIILFRLLSREQAKEVFQHLLHDEQEDVIKGLAANSNQIADLLNDLDPDDRTAFFEELPGKVSQRLMQIMSEEEREITRRLLGYPEDSIGRLMTPEYVAVKPYFTVAQALDHIRIYGRDSETLNVIYVVDENWKLIDDLRMKELILASPDQRISELVDNRFVALKAYDDQEVAVKVFKDYDRVALPVIDTNGVLVGIVTIDDVIDVVEEENTEDFHKFGSLQEGVINPLKARVGFLYKKRVLWLTVLVFMNVFSGAAIASFEAVIGAVVSLVFFLPLLIGSGGNAGSQSATLMIRALATGDVETKDWIRLLGKELLVSFLLGATMAVGVSLIAGFRAPEVVVVVALTMVITVIVGSLLGMLLPFVFTKFKADPATASAPLITSIADICGVMIYFSIATWYFGL
ncbi:magnesium transporter [Parabacteroides sp. PF5-9]|uniref:magnesium transporter n=1 Tax=Parabacteroides sp. PF5-9 TaxID=1742404 RepID=UPI0024744A11|nr:magnesium transporter [Parabacteroides sp. PF5-9]MDH6357950.1 magnesium transporter [Parabacteroides sp. PF5-9]